MSETTPTTDEVRDSWVEEDSRGYGGDPEAFDRWLAAVEAAVRADQIEKDAHLADQVGHLHNNAHSHAAWEAAQTIRAQQDGEK